MSDTRHTLDDELGLLLDEMDTALMAAVRARLTPSGPDDGVAHGTAPHAVLQEAGQDEDEVLDHALGTTDDTLLKAIERRTARTHPLSAPARRARRKILKTLADRKSVS